MVNLNPQKVFSKAKYQLQAFSANILPALEIITKVTSRVATNQTLFHAVVLTLSYSQ